VPNEVGAASIPQGLSLVFCETSHNLPAERVQKVCQKRLIPPAGGGSSKLSTYAGKLSQTISAICEF